jgi:hypothetical protein
MEHRIHLYIHNCSDDFPQILQALQTLNEKVDSQMATLDEGLASVRAANTKVDSLIALFKALQQQLKGAGLSPADQAKVDSIFSEATAEATTVQAAMDENVPPAPAP